MSERTRDLPRRSCLSVPGSSERFLAKGPSIPAAMTFLRLGHIGVEAQSETTRGLINVDDICAASTRLETIIFGPADFAASMEMPILTAGVQIPEYPGDHFHYVFSKILMAGRANGLQVIDGPYLRIRDTDGFRDFAMRTRILGFDGKWVLHPDQVTVCNELFSP